MTQHKHLSRRDLLKLLGAGAAASAFLSGCADEGLALLDEGNGEFDLRSRLAVRQGCPSTRLVTEYGLKYPFASAGMAFVALEDLVVAVSEAGGMGMLGATPEPPDFLRARLQNIKARTTKPFGVDFVLAEANGQPFTGPPHIDICAQEQVPLVVFHFGVPPASWIDTLHAAGTRVWVQCATLDMADDALCAGADGIVAQGSEAGGHNLSTIKRQRLLRDIRRHLAPPVLLAAGGIADARSAAKALREGADGVWVGTRLVASQEAYAHPTYKARIVAAGRRDTRFTTLFGPEWPAARQRVLRNRVVEEWAGREDEIPSPPPPPAVIGATLLFPGIANVPYPMPKFSAIVPTPDSTGDFEEMDLPAGGESAARIRSVRPAREIIDEMMLGAGGLLEGALEG